ncbi:hypothetical protein MetMK1DRAFT_00008200 [Metallosphaera yellowstonensis MK1]|jgi:Predicted site-specific integrase-resolvase|uniref:Resolvase/invertase-type recombinase catalytic domain-containing protein n=1 Tax=Metallosphaera yellowstonensis MK1 TaxID=671065 RepID=H2C247_9CREN|nr:hypothetical protein MetMK1DRAFT_00008200 [Metallosphaera yellowstonensis MK1]
MMLRPKEVCQRLGISYATLREYVKKGYIKPVLETGKWRFREEDIEKLMGIVRKRKVILYARVSSNTQKDDLINQVKYLEKNVKEYESNNRRGIFIKHEEERIPQVT